MKKKNKCGGNWRDVWFNQVYVVSEKISEMFGDVNKLEKSISFYERNKEKNEMYGHVNKSVKSMCLQKKRKIIDTTKFEVDIVLEKEEKRKKLKRIEVRTKHLGLVENRSRPRIGGQVDHLCS